MLQKNHEQKDDAVSPVIGVMLMLVVTIIIAAAVAAFAGGITGTTEETPTIMAKTEIWSFSKGTVFSNGRFAMTVESVSAPISTKDLKLVTIWTNSTTGEKSGSEVVAGTMNTDYSTKYEWKGEVKESNYMYNSPIGYGTSIETQSTSGNFTKDQWFGNYQLTAGTSLATSGSSTGVDEEGTKIDPVHDAGDGLDAILGKNWSSDLKKGNIVTVQLIYLPTNTVIYNEEVIVK